MTDLVVMKCAKCGKAIKFPRSKIGAVAKCPGCQNRIKLVDRRPVKKAQIVRKETVSRPVVQQTPPTPPMIATQQETASTASVPVVAEADTKIAKFISDGQPIKTVAKLLSRIESLCTESEVAQYIAVQHLPAVASPDAIVLTDRRVIIFRGKALGRMNMVDVPWLDVSNIHIKEGFVGATLSVTGTNGHLEKIDHLPKAQARSVYRVGQEREEQMREYRRTRQMEEDRNAAGNVVVNTAVQQPAAQPESSGGDLTSRLTQLKTMLDNGLITQDEFDTKKTEILASL